MPKNPEKFEPETEEDTETEPEEKVERGIEEEKIETGEEFKETELEKRKRKEEEKEKLEKTQEELEEEFKGIEEKKEEKGEVEEREKRLETIKEALGETVPESIKRLVGDDSKEAWEERKKLEPMLAAISLAGVASEKSQGWLDEHKETQKLWWGVCQGLMGDDSEKAWEIRDYLKFDQKVKRVRGGIWARMQKSSGLHKSEGFFNLKKGLGKRIGFYGPGDVVISTTGLDSEKAQGLRKEFKDLAPAEVLMSLAGNDSEEAQRIREKHKEDKKLRWAHEKSLIGIEA